MTAVFELLAFFVRRLRAQKLHVFAAGIFLFGRALHGSALLDDWRGRNPLPTASGLWGVSYGNGAFVAVGDHGTILTSSDGFAWVGHLEPTNFFDRITFGNGIFAASGYGGISTSADGIAWTRRMDSRVNELAYLKGQFVGVGFGITISSADGVSWSKSTIATPANLSGIAFGEGQFVAVGFVGSIFTSTNGVAWTARTSNIRQALWGAAFGNGTFVAVGDEGTILQTASPQPRFRAEETRRSDDGIMRLMVETPTGIDFVLEGSGDFNLWQPVGMVTNCPGVLEMSDPISQTLERRFYRIKQLSP